MLVLTTPSPPPCKGMGPENNLGIARVFTQTVATNQVCSWLFSREGARVSSGICLLENCLSVPHTGESWGFPDLLCPPCPGKWSYTSEAMYSVCVVWHSLFQQPVCVCAHMRVRCEQVCIHVHACVHVQVKARGQLGVPPPLLFSTLFSFETRSLAEAGTCWFS